MQPISKYVGNRRYTAGTCDDELVDDSNLKQNLGNTKKNNNPTTRYYHIPITIISVQNACLSELDIRYIPLNQ